MRTSHRLLPAFLAAGLAACGGSDSGETELVVFAAASLRDVTAELAVEFERRHPAKVIYNFAGSNTLAQQIRAAPGADVFLSADEAWIDFLDQAGRTIAGSRRTFLTNSLALIAHRDANLEIEHPRDLVGAVTPEGNKGTTLRFLALADPQAVPAGRYARAALERIDTAGGSLWNALADKIAPTLDVRAALALVESDPEIAGIVYKTDVMTSDKVRVLYEFPTTNDAPIRYLAALITDGAAPEPGRRFLDFLASSTAHTIAERHGFGGP